MHPTFPSLLASALDGPSTCPILSQLCWAPLLLLGWLNIHLTEPLPCLPYFLIHSGSTVPVNHLAWTLRWGRGGGQFRTHRASALVRRRGEDSQDRIELEVNPCLLRFLISTLGVILDFMKKKPRLPSKAGCLMSGRCCQGTTDYEKYSKATCNFR